MSYVPLHVHSEYSFLSSTIPVRRLCVWAAAHDLPALALTDEGGLWGAMLFHDSCTRQGIKPIPGFEASVAQGRSGPAGKALLLAENATGWRNLRHLSSAGYLNGTPSRPSIDWKSLHELAEGVIACSSCMDHPSGEPNAAFADALVGALGEKNVFVALDSPSAPSVSLAERKGLPVVAACEARCITRDDTRLLSLLECIRDGTRFDATAATRQVRPSLHLRTPEEMARLFSGLPQALAHTRTIADRCSVDPRRPPRIPPVRIPRSLKSEEEYLEQLAYAGLEKKYHGCAQSVRERLAYELRVIRDNGFEGLFLLHAHLAATAADMGIMTAVRGSGSGSLTAYLVGITDVDPLLHGLYFERFLNPERVTIPDFVLDVGHKDRERLIKHLTELYGPESVCGICAFTRLRRTRAAREVATAMGFEISGPEELEQLTARNETVRSYAERIDGLVERPAIHSCGVLIAPGDVRDFVPVYRPRGPDRLVCQYDAMCVEDAGMIKLDILEFAPLTVQRETRRLVRETAGEEIDIKSLPVDDTRTLALLARGDTLGVPLFESDGIRESLRALHPGTVGDLAALNALYRPGLLESIPVFIRRNNGEEKTAYPHPMLKEILGEACGIIVYQEQIMAIAHRIGGLTLAAADHLRRALARRKEDAVNELRPAFFTGARTRGLEQSTAAKVFARMADAACLALSKAHAMSYTHLAYRSAYLKAHYPRQFMTALLDVNSNHPDRFEVLTREAARMGVGALRQRRE